MSNVTYYNGQLYDNPIFGMASASGGIPNYLSINNIQPIGGIQNSQTSSNTNNGNLNNPFASASSGGVRGTLQPYINRMTQNASNALYGGLLGYSPQSMVAGNAGGTPQNSQVPQWRLPSAIPTPNQGQIGLLGAQANPQQQMGVFGNRSWMAA